MADPTLDKLLAYTAQQKRMKELKALADLGDQSALLEYLKICNQIQELTPRELDDIVSKYS
jgi:hypothetical protein